MNVGILDPYGLNNNPFTNEPYSEQYKELAKIWSKFPAYEKAEEIIKEIKNNQVILIVSGTGSGKTVLLPKYAIHALDYKGKIAITLPKQIIAKSAAEFSAKTLDVVLGEEVGYQYKGSEENSRSKKTQLLYATDGTIVARLLNDPYLKDFDAVIIDEAHERKVQIDFLLYLLKQTIQLRPEFKLIIMSATVNAEIFSSYFNTFKYKSIDIGGQTNYPITSIFAETRATPNEYLDVGYNILKKIMLEDDINKEGSHDILFFVTSISETMDICEKMVKDELNGYCVEVYSGMDNQKQIIAQTKGSHNEFGKERKVVIATNVAESSLTIDGIKFVIDSGYEISSYYDPERHAKVLEKKLITHAQAKQRMGRAGRTESGICYHLYTKNDFENVMEKYPEPSIRTSNIIGETLRLLNIPTINNVNNLLSVFSQFIEPPKEKYIKNSIKQLMQLGLIKNEEITPMGKLVADLQVEPNVGVSIITAYKFNLVSDVCIIFAFIDAIKNNLSELYKLPSDIIEDTPENKQRLNSLKDKFNTARKKHFNKHGDHLSLLKVFEKYQTQKDKKKQNDWAYESFIRLTIMEKVEKYYKKLYNNSKRILSGMKNYDNQELLKLSDNEKILLSLYNGFRLNTAFNRDRTYTTLNNVQDCMIGKDSFILLNDKKPSKIFYYELFIGSNKKDLNIVSSIPKSFDNLMNLL